MSKHGKGKLRSIHVTTGNNGYSVEAHHESPSEGGKRSVPMPIGDGERPSFFNSKQAMLDHINNLAAEHEGSDGDSDDNSGEAKAPNQSRTSLSNVLRAGRR